MFDELRIKSILKKKLSQEAYSKLSSKIKRDSRVIEHLLQCDPEAINLFDHHKIKKYVLEDYSLVSKLNESNLRKIFSFLDLSKVQIDKEMFSKLDESSKYKVLEYSTSSYFGLLDEKDINIEVGRCIYSYYQAKFNKEENHIDIEFLNKMISEMDGDSLLEVSKYNDYVKEHLVDLIRKYDFEKLLELYEQNNEIVDFFEDNVKRKITIIKCDGNIDKILNLDVDTQIEYFKYNINQLRYASRNVIEEFLKEYDHLDSSILIKLGYESFSEYVSRLSKDEQMKVFAASFKNVYECTRGYLASFNLDDIMYDKICMINDVDKRKALLTFYKTLENEKINPRDSYIYHNEKYQLSRMLYDDNIVNNNSVELIEKYRDTYDRRILIEILSNAYGDHVVEIFKSRPLLNLFDVDNFKIFDKKIYDKLGAGFVHYLLNCNMGILNNFVSKLSENEELFDKFVDYFKCITSNKNNIDINVITNLIKKFKIHEDILKNLDYDNLSDYQRKTLELFVLDSDDLIVYVQNSEDFDSYLDLRRKRFIEIGRNVEYGSDMKDLIFSYVTGRTVSEGEEYDLESNEKMFLEKLTLESAIKVFNIDNIVKNDEIITKIGLSQDEVSILLLLHEINRINNLDVLKNTFEALVNRNLDSTLFMGTFDKIRDYYIEDVKNNLLSKEKIESMPKSIVDGVEVIDFNGVDFSLICSVQGLNLSNPNMFSDATGGKKLLFDWITREKGCTVISTALVSSDTEIYPVNKDQFNQISNHMVFVFDSDVSIIGMGGSDISSEHEKNPTSHYFRFVGDENHDNGFSTMEELKDRINQNKHKDFTNKKFHSEITIARSEEDIRKEDSGKRVMPVGLYVIGEITKEHLETAKVFNKYYESKGLGSFKIIRVDPLVYKGEGVKTQNLESVSINRR